MDTKSRIEALIKRCPHSGCWNWIGSCGGRGYGKIKVAGRTRQAHLVLWELLNGTVQAGLELDHLCRNKRCVNPAHLEPVTHRVNMLRSAAFAARALSPVCSKGHLLDGVRSRASGGRYCKTCVAISKRRQRATVS